MQEVASGAPDSDGHPCPIIKKDNRSLWHTQRPASWWTTPAKNQQMLFYVYLANNQAKRQLRY
ncbi:MAG: hypothetical protein JKX75_02340 [Gammaproteobacteria bacterium]|nr:hypothetical protein [Gammaproteobacteria bacterium]